MAPYTVGIDGLGAQGRGSHTDDEDLEIVSPADYKSIDATPAAEGPTPQRW